MRRTPLSASAAEQNHGTAAAEGRLRPFILIAVLTISQSAHATPPESPILADLTFEQLSEITITTASKRPESLANTAAAVTVITGSEIHKLGVTSIPQALRDITGLSVARINGSTWGVGARGFSGQFATKLLVMIDGRSVYTPVFGGVFWDTQDYLLEDIDRIEVVLGTGGSLWGANAVNGVINILTKNAQDTPGDLLKLSTGTQDTFTLGARHGWQLAPDTFGRVYLKYRTTRDTFLPNGDRSGDATKFLQGGWRLDATRGTARWTLQGDAYRGWNDFRITLPTLAAPPTYNVTDTSGEETSGANILGRWDTTLASGGTFHVQAYLDQAKRSGPIFDTRVTTADFELQHSLAPIARQEIAWGLSARLIHVGTRDRWIRFSPQINRSSIESVFVQDRISLVPDRLALTAGLKLEHSSVSGLEPQPNVRLAWQPSDRHTLWAGWSRAVRTPAYTEFANITDAVVFLPGVRDPVLPAALRGLGNPLLKAETLGAVEAGWRWHTSERLNLTLTGFLNTYDRLIKVTGATPYVQSTPNPALIIPLPEDNGMSGNSSGGELAARWQVNDHWRLAFGYAHSWITLRAETPDPFNFTANARVTPRNTASLISTWEPTRAWEFVTVWRHVDRVIRYGIPAYLECDLQLTWRPHPDWEIALTGQNLLDPHHPEGRPGLAGPATETARNVGLRFSWSK